MGYQSKFSGQQIDAYLDSIEIINITWSQLIEKRNNNQLIPGGLYRITDYITTTTQEDTRSVGHLFDVIVFAIDNCTLSEEARVAYHEGDLYFTQSASNLSAWKIWYCLNNDVERFVWADVDNGKGVIYRMIDEYGNDCPYDFKNIQFKRYQITSDHEVFVDNKGIIEGTYVGIKPTSLLTSTMHPAIRISNENDFKYYYTFSTIVDSEIADLSLKNTCRNNTFHSCTSETNETYVILNNTVLCANLICDNFFSRDCSNNTLFQDNNCNLSFNSFHWCCGNVFTGNCHLTENNIHSEFNSNIVCANNADRATLSSNNIGYLFKNNIIANDLMDCNIGIQSQNNIILAAWACVTTGAVFSNNVSKGKVSGCVFGGWVTNNTFNNLLEHSSFGDSLSNNVFNGTVSYSTIGPLTKANVFGAINAVVIGSRCQNNNIGNISASQIGIGFRYNTFKCNAQLDSSDRDVTGCTFGDYVWYNNFYNTTDSSEKIKCLTVQSYLQGASASNINHILVPTNSTAEIKVARNSNGEMKVYCEADLV